MSDEGDMVSMFAQIHGAWGRLDVQVNNAGVSRLPGDGFDEMMAGEGSQITLMGPRSVLQDDGHPRGRHLPVHSRGRQVDG
ncbi:MAG: hypothetical protein Ct9H300mP12_17210 [Acidimicrobiales bacterium]|nr:MAG: hypothetical protein Ct9H300mP12_17210 [Acidimicrobiales bacterium]